ncbi:MAG: hypothetical protein CVV27_18525 [Candidatus Melainabacteria bacterium HGW-Melainabacteria-1]|nr:MAG: hypothetical protein CVV27_18525 [Candidatus Melainabacteria bacterium HGW-Melainabacteria-1]
MTLTDANGMQHDYQIVHQIDFEGQTYLLGLDASGVHQELVVFSVDQAGVELVMDEALLSRLQIHLQSEVPPEALKVTLETQTGEHHEFSIVGKLEIQGKDYVLAAAADDPDELIALRFEGENLSLVEDEAEQALVNQHLMQLRQAHELHG